MASGSSGNPYEHYGNDTIEQDLIDPDDGTRVPCLYSNELTENPANINDLDDPLENDRAPLTGNIQSSSSRNPISQSYLNSSIPGEDRRAPINTIDESVWDTLSRDLKASWEKMRLVLWPKYLLGGMLQREGGLGGLERGEGGNLIEGLRGIAGRISDADTLLQGGMSEGLRDWDLWYVAASDGKFGVTRTHCCPKGSASVFLTSQFVAIHHCRAERRGLYRSLCSDLDRIGDSDLADTAAGREDVSRRRS